MQKEKILSLFMSALLLIPAYPGSKKTGQEKILNGNMEITLIYYQSSDAATQILDFYVHKLSQSGWTLDQRDNDPPHLRFSAKDQSQLSIECSQISGRGINAITIIHTPPMTQEMMDALSKGTDFPGKDIPSIPRYPGAIRKSYEQQGRAISITYEVKQKCFDCVLRFYRAEVVARGWKLLDETKGTIGKAFADMAARLKSYPDDFKKQLPKEVDLAAVAQETAKLAAEFAKYPLAVLSFQSKSASAGVSITDSGDKIVIMIDFSPKK